MLRVNFHGKEIITVKDTERHRRNFASFCTVIGGLVTLVSLAMTYSVFTESFTDWTPAARKALTLACCGTIEGTAAALIYGLVYALAGRMERLVAFFGLVFVGGVMGVNIITHSMQVRRMPLEDWQHDYLAWVGPGVLIGIFIVIVLMVIVRFETRILKGERELEMQEVEASLEAQRQLVESDDFRNYLNRHKQIYFDRIGQRLGLMSTVTELTQEQVTYPKVKSR
jgi:hypothetical protein